jgi:two-component system, OmpR family, sensor kinase
VRGDLYRPWLVSAAACTALMWVWPGDETIPYHVAWAAFALLYGFGDWPLRRAVSGLALVTVTTGGILLARAAGGVIAWEETAEIPLMALLMVLMVWHVRRRQAALAEVTLMAGRERELARDRERLTRLTSHEMRTPLTIARGYVEMLLAADEDEGRRADLAVVDDELARLTRVTERLVRAIRLQGDTDVERVDLDMVLRQTAERWAPVARRRWVVDAHAGSCEGSVERLRASLDTLVENAVRYTVTGDVIRLTGSRTADVATIGVGDSGAGLSPEQVDAINGTDHLSAQTPRDALSQTGLGLGLVRGVVAARGGSVSAGRSPEGGALLLLRIPVEPPVGRLPGAVVGPTARGGSPTTGATQGGDVVLQP